MVLEGLCHLDNLRSLSSYAGRREVANLAKAVMSRAEYTGSPSETRNTKTPKFFVFDCETSGLDARRDRVVELAVVEYVPGQKMEDIAPHSILVNPDRKLTKRNIKVHGITDAMLKDEQYFPDAWKTFLAYVECACAEDERPVLVAHRAIFDVNFLREELRRNKIHVPKWDVACSLALARAMWPGEPAKLGNLTARFGIDGFAEHRAGGDVQGLCKVLDGIADIIERSGESVTQHLLRTSFALRHSGPSHASISQPSSSPHMRLRSASSFSVSEPTYQSGRTDVGTLSRMIASKSLSSGDTTQPPSIHEADGFATPTRDVRDVGSPSSECSARHASSSAESPSKKLEARSSNSGGLVFVTATGSCYHVVESCYGLRKARTVSTSPKSEAVKTLRACKVCSKHEHTVANERDNESSPSRLSSPRSIMATAANFEEAPYYRSPTGARYHVRFDCYGLRKAKAKIPCDIIPSGLTPCKVCVSP